MQRYSVLVISVLILLLFACSGKDHAGVEAGNSKVAGVILDSAGTPVRGALVCLVSAVPPLDTLAKDTTDSLGLYELLTDPGEYVLQVFVEDSLWVTQPVTLDSASKKIDVELPGIPIASMDEFTDTTGFITDSRDGQQYPWVRIGNQVWLAKNLNYSGTDGNGNRAYQFGWCYGSDVSDTSSHVDYPNCEEYGRLYSWKVAMVLPDSCDTLFCSSLISSRHQGICPDGWRLPDTLDFVALDSFVREEQGDTLGMGFSEHYLKISNADTNWNRTPFVSSDPYGFSMKPGGSRTVIYGIGLSDGSLGSYGYMWTASEYTQPGGAYTWEFNSTVMVRSSAAKLGWANSVRCLR